MDYQYAFVAENPLFLFPQQQVESVTVCTSDRHRISGLAVFLYDDIADTELAD
jgi:hypothetical protein